MFRQLQHSRQHAAGLCRKETGLQHDLVCGSDHAPDGKMQENWWLHHQLSGRRVVCQYEVLLGRSPAWLGERHRRSEPQHSLQTQLIQQPRSAGARESRLALTATASATQANPNMKMRDPRTVTLGLVL